MLTMAPDAWAGDGPGPPDGRPGPAEDAAGDRADVDDGPGRLDRERARPLVRLAGERVVAGRDGQRRRALAAVAEVGVQIVLAAGQVHHQRVGADDADERGQG